MAMKTDRGTYPTTANAFSMKQATGFTREGSINELTYAHNGSQLQSVNDVNDGYGPHQASGFSDHGSFLTTEYIYDANGNCLGLAHSGSAVAYDISADANKSCIMVDKFYNPLVIASTTLFSSGYNDILIAKIDSVSGIYNVLLTNGSTSYNGKIIFN